MVDTFNGSGETRTDTPFFTIDGPQWRVAYEAENIAPPPVGMLFAFFIRNERGQPLDPNGVAIRSEQSGIENVNSDPGRYYIQIISSQVEWTLRVEDCGDQGGGSPVSDEERREEVIPGSFKNEALPRTGGPAILAPAVGLLILSTAMLGLLRVRRR